MKTIAVSMMKDEADICYWTVKNMVQQVDTVLVLDNNSSDNTAELCKAAGAIVFPDPSVAYYQSEKMTNLAKTARLEYGADWVVPFDADEIWYSPFGKISDLLSELSPQWLAASAKMYNHYATAKDPEFSNPIKRLGWRHRESGALPKVACRWREDMIIHQGNHSAFYEGGTTVFDNYLVIRHYPYRSPEQFLRKIENGSKAYRATTLEEDVGAHWRSYGQLLEKKGPDAVLDVYRTWFYSAEPEKDNQFIYDPAPVD